MKPHWWWDDYYWHDDPAEDDDEEECHDGYRASVDRDGYTYSAWDSAEQDYYDYREVEVDCR